MADPSLFMYRKEDIVLFLLLCVDNIIVIGNSSTAIQALLHQLSTEFDIKDLGPLKFFLGL